MADYLVNSDELTAIADAIREKAALQGVPLLYPFGFATEIMNIPQEWDDDFIRALIERTFTQFSNSRIRSAGAYTFAGCSRLSIVNLPNLVSFAPRMFQSCTALVDVEFPNVLYGATGVFADCFNLEYVNLPLYQESARVWASNSYYSYRAIPASMFYQCSKLIDIGGIDFDRIEYIGDYAFESCYLFGRINDFTHLVKTGTGAFCYCSNLYELTLPELTAVEYRGFYQCRNLSYVSLPQALVLSGYAFEYCYALEEIYCPNVKSLGYGALGYCSSLTEFSAPLCTSMNTSVFYRCINLQSIYMPLVSMLSSRSMSMWTYGSYFAYCSNLETLVIDRDLFASIVPAYTFIGCSKLPFDNLNFATCSVIGSGAFSSCYLLSYLYAPNCSIVFDGAFAYCSNLTSIVLDYSLISCVSSSTYKYTQISIASFPSCTKIESDAFASCSALITAYFPRCSTVSTSAFTMCTALETIQLPSCTSIGSYVFRSCSSLTQISLPLCKTINSYAFYACINLPTINLPECTAIGSWCFESCYSLSEISLPKCSSVAPGAFAHCSSLTEINLSLCSRIEQSTFTWCSGLTNVTLINCQAIGSSAFQYCYRLSTLTLPNCSIIYSSAFYYCSRLSNISLPSCQVLSRSAFYGCASYGTYYLPRCYSIDYYALPTHISSITLGPSYSILGSYTLRYYAGSYLELSYIQEIRTSGFWNASGLTAVSLPACKKMSSYAFYSTTTLRSVYLLNSTVVSIDYDPSYVFYPNTMCRELTFYVPASLLDSYKNHSKWKLISSQFYSIY